MHWTDEAIVLSSKKHGENSAVVRVFAQKHGVFAGVIKGAHSKTNRGVFQPGNLLSCHWSARLSEHLGTFKCELIGANAALIMQDAGRLAALTSACALVETSMPERHPYARLYSEFLGFLEVLKDSPDWAEAYIMFELMLLAESGFGLDLTHCAATGKTDDLVYVSPKSGRAVSRVAGDPYKEKMLLLPGFLHGKAARGSQEILAGLRLSGYFLEHWLAQPHGKKLPAARGRLIENMKERHGKNAKTEA